MGRVITQAPFGRTGHTSSRVIFGAAALGTMAQDRADRLLELLLEAGVNHLDTAAGYGDSELRLAPWLAAHPGRFFVATKTGEWTGDGARASLERSLDRLGVSRVDLIQLHNLVEPEDWETAHGPGGAVAALARARDEGLVGAVGVTGHGLRIAGMHRRSLERFDFASVLLPYNPALLAEPTYRHDVEDLLDVCAARSVAVQTIKAAARRRWLPDDPRPHYSWYEPLPVGAELERAVRWVLARPQLFLNTSSDATLLRAILAAAGAAGPAPTDDEVAADAARLEARPLFDGHALERI